MTQLATIQGNGNGVVERLSPTRTSVVMSFEEKWDLAGCIAKSRLFGIETPEQAMCLMMICESKGLHPADAMTRYHIVKNKATMTAAAMQSDFQAQGGVIELIERTNSNAAAFFSHPVTQPKPVRFDFSMEDAARAKLTSTDGMYSKYPAAMLWWRLVTEAIRVIYPGIVTGIYTPEEAEEIAYNESPRAAIESSKAQAEAAVVAADVSVPGWHKTGFDGRQYHEVVSDGVGWLNAETLKLWAEAFGSDAGAPKTVMPPDAHRYMILRAVNLGLCEQPMPPKMAESIKTLATVYKSNREWVRSELKGWLEEQVGKVGELIKEKQSPAPTTAREPGAEG